ncbi:Protein transport protein SEC23 [Tritrichomonas foetus]|uniref:Protein transport protein SEC23 n=1 Tax=Tritrichomonas foetus TaxID=1144522 RepID=A0A1J4L3U6_9EUKA|nr:Protein transport protein SEC23 [Tritrichomonas foetus]|eukprot:OHT16644.1 Protein transport protein SEC23 [Tritrichomonas foetus]
MDFNQVEDQNGIRFAWNTLPTNRVDASSSGLPLGCLYTPLKQIPDHQPNKYGPVVCQRCHSVLNPYSRIDFANKTWSCPICKTISPLPSTYHGMTQECLVAECHPNYTTIEYTLPEAASFPPIFLFVVDTCLTEKEHQALKTLLLQAIGTLPPSSLVGFISFGKLVYIHELRFSECPRNFVFNGLKTYDVAKLKQCLSLNSVSGPNSNDGQNDFILPVSDAEQMLNSIVDTLEVDPFVVERGNRFERCTGAAVDIAVTLLESLFPRASAQIVLFSGGPITRGPGSMAALKRSDVVRQHRDIESGKAEMTTKSREFFSQIAKRACLTNVAVNVISASFEESGLYEISPLVQQTGGFMLANESFTEENISRTLIKYFKGGVFQNSGADAAISFRSSNAIKVTHVVGPCAPMNALNSIINNNNNLNSSNSGENQWKVCGLLPTTTFSFFFEITQSKTEPVPDGEFAFIQFQTRYRHISDGDLRLRVTTATLQFADLSTNKQMLINGFDQEAASVLLAKQAMYSIQNTNTGTTGSGASSIASTISSTISSSSAATTAAIVESVDRQLIRFCRTFGDYTPKQPSSFQLAPQLQFLPMFVFHFRRSPFLSTFNSTPDQTASLRHALMCEDVTNSLFMIQPTLMKYSLDQAPTPVILDTSSLRNDCVLLLDTYFRVLIWHGSTIAAWRNQGYQEQEEYQNLKAALEQPKSEAQALVDERFPTPQFASCDQDSSLARYLLARCNPSTDASFASAYGPGENLSTDEPSLANFTQKLKNVAVNGK